MTPPQSLAPSVLVEIVCRGALPAHERDEFPGWEVQNRAGQTWLTAPAVDQAGLHGALDRLHVLGLRLVEVRHFPQIKL
jgi:hypothetical protein